MFYMSIPELSDEELLERYVRVPPVVEVNGRLTYFKHFSLLEMKQTSYLWAKEAKPTRVGKDELTVMEGQDFACLHRYSYPGLFKPTVAEVLSQISDEALVYARAFQIIDWPKTSEDFYRDSVINIAFRNGFYISTVRLYTLADMFKKYG